jgi:hypothetical protein
MTYNSSFAMNTGLGMPGAGYASRGKANGLKRLNLASPPKLGSLNENGVDETPPPRTSRSYLLAGLRTAPKTPSVPSSAPYNQLQHGNGNGNGNGMEQSRYAQQLNVNNGYAMNNGVPHTASGSSFPSQYQAGQQFYHLPEQVLAPPNFESEFEEDPQMLAQLQATKSMLAFRQQLLQQQLANLTAQQFAAMNLGGAHMAQMYNSPSTPLTPQLGMYNQLGMAGVQPIVNEVPGQPGIYTVYNPLTGQTTLAADTSRQEPQLANSPPPPTPHSVGGFKIDTPSRRQMSPQHEIQSPFGNNTRSISPPKKTPSPPADVQPLPPPSANAFRRGHHKKVSSLSLSNNPVADGPKSAFLPRSHAIPPTPLTGTFGPGQARAGEHPLRQPRGPPSIEELKAKPTSHFEGSLNFAARRRRQALSNLMRAGLERRVRPGSGSNGSMTPVSESELTFSVPSDNDSDSGRSAHGAIGSERKASRERLVDEPVVAAPEPARRAKAPLLALANAAEKRRTVVF